MLRRVHVGSLLLGALALLAFAAVYSLELHNRDLRDFGTFWASGDAARQHLDPYAVYPLTWRVHRGRGVQIDPNLSPPALLPAFEGIAHWRPWNEVFLWTFASACAFLGSAVLVAFAAGFTVERRNLLWMLLAPSVLHTLWLGQDYAFLALLSAAVWLCFRRGWEIGAGICLGLICAAKPNFLLWPVLLLAARYRRTPLVCLSVFVVLSGLPIALYGPGVYGEWLRAFSLTNHSMYPTDVSLAGFAERLGSRFSGELLAVLLAAGTFLWAFVRRPPFLALAGVGICAGILCAPLAWFHYTVLLMPWMAARRWDWRMTVAALLLMLPLDARTTIGLPYIAAVFAAMGSLVYCVEISIIGRPVDPEFVPIAVSPSNVSRIM